MSNENEKKPEEGLTEEELADVTGGAGAVAAPHLAGAKTITTTEHLPGGASAIHVKSLFGALPNGGTRVIKQAGG
ncbi:MAG TPA: hypothetical protein VLT33_20855 [Labilithrix sp.]|nr:hypothetical protein [Labilithrix sp.]